MAATRKTRSDPGILALVRALMQEVLGLNADTTSKIMRIIRSSGQLQDMKQNMRSLNALAYRRLNHAIDIIEKQEKRETKKEEADEKNNNSKVAKKEEVKESFINYLLNELQLDTGDIATDPEVKQDALRLTRANPQQAASLEKRMRREKMQKDRKELQAEEDPRKKALRRSIMQREKQLQAQKDELAGGEQRPTDGGATM